MKSAFHSIAIVASVLLSATPAVTPRDVSRAPASSSPARFEVSPSVLWETLDRLLLERVDADGLVNYAGIARDPVFVEAWSALLAVDAEALGSWPRSEQLAFWINAYNLATLRLVGDHYPIEGRFPIDLIYPDSSILMIPGRWGNSYPIAGATRSLDSIEHDVLRKQFAEPRIHFAIVCASLGCPVLRSEAFRGGRLDQQLEDQARRYFSRPSGLQVGSGKRLKLKMTKILDWFGDDFEALPADPGIAATQKGSRGVLVARVARWFPEDIQDRLRQEQAEFGWVSYDWSLNEHRPRD